MKILSTAVLLLAAVRVAPSQQGPDFLMIILQRSSLTRSTGVTTNDCVLVQGDGSFRREHESVHVSLMNWTDVYEGRLSAADLSALSAAIDSEEFRTMNSELPPGSASLMDSDLIQINVLRSGGAQKLQIDGKARKAHEKTLKPLLTWWSKAEKIKLPKIKDGKSTGCQPEMLPQGKTP